MQKDPKSKRRGPAAALKLMRSARDDLVSSGASLKQGFRKIAAGCWSGIKHTVRIIYRRCYLPLCWHQLRCELHCSLDSARRLLGSSDAS